MKKDFIDHLTSVPALLTIAALLCVIIYCFFIQPQNYYVVNSNVLAKGSYIDKASNNDIKFQLIPNFFGEIKKNYSYQKDIPMLELQKAAYRKELKVLDNLKNTPDDPQTIFDTAIWYIASSGIKSKVEQVKQDRQARLIAGYYYLKILEKLDPKSEETKRLITKIDQYIEKEIENDQLFIDRITQKPTKNLKEPPSLEEIEHITLLDNYKEDPKNIVNLENICNYYDKQINDSKFSRKLGYLIATKSCYSNLQTLSPDNNEYTEKIKTLSKDIKTFNYTLK